MFVNVVVAVRLVSCTDPIVVDDSGEVFEARDLRDEVVFLLIVFCGGLDAVVAVFVLLMLGFVLVLWWRCFGVGVGCDYQGAMHL